MHDPLAVLSGGDGAGFGNKAPLNAMGSPDGASSTGGAMKGPLQDAAQQRVLLADVQGGLAQLALEGLDVAPEEARAAQHPHPPRREVEHL